MPKRVVLEDPMRDVFIYDAIRTPTGRHGGGLASVRPDDLAATTIGQMLGRSPALDPTLIGDVIFGNANGAGEENRNVGRMAVLLAGLPTSVPGSTVNRLCGSGLEAVVQASRAIAVDDADIIVAGGVESMTRAPWVLEKPAKPFAHGNQTLYSTTLGWRFPNPEMPAEWRISLGDTAEILADRYSISREKQDEYAFDSHHKADAAWAAGHFEAEIIHVPGVDISRDESIRADTTLEKLATLKPAFKQGGSVTGGNSSPLNDGASAILLGNESAGSAIGSAPLARIAGRGVSGVDPDVFGIGPVEACAAAMRRAGIGWDDLDLVEINEAFASQVLACLHLMPQLNPENLNVSGGAISLGHALGSSGSRILTTLAHNLKRTGGRWGLASLCIGMGQGIAVVIEAA
jgi:acetyl-CoA acetyltransferase family protein